MDKNKKPASLKILWAFMIINLLVSAFAIAINFRQKDKIIYVDAIELMRSYKGMERVKVLLEEKSRKWRSNLDTLDSEVNLAKNDFEKRKNGISISEKKLIVELINSKQEQLFNYQQVVDGQYKKLEKELLDDLLVKINARIKLYAEQNGLDVILSAGQQGNIAYANDRLNVTKKLIEILNNEYDLKK